MKTSQLMLIALFLLNGKFTLDFEKHKDMGSFHYYQPWLALTGNLLGRHAWLHWRP
jgi:hypothetical protein